MIKSFFLKFAKKAYLFFQRDYHSKTNYNKNVFISYIPGPLFKKKSDEKYFSKHQNRREITIIVKIFEEMHYNVHCRRFDKPILFPKKYDIVFGLEPNFERVCKKNKNAIKIYYATGSYYKHQNRMIKERTDEFNQKNNTNIQYSRLVPQHNSCEISDYIIQIGGEYTLETYPKEIQKKVMTIHQSKIDCDKRIIPDEKIRTSNSNEFIWIGSQGSILKGLDLIIDYFSKNPNQICHCFGQLENDFNQYVKTNKLKENIIFHGFVNIRSKEVQDILDRALFCILPSGSEGCPGGILYLIEKGLIPIVSKYATFYSFKNGENGILIEELSEIGLEKAINKTSSMDRTKLKDIIYNNLVVASEYNLMSFENDFKSSLKKIISIRS